jgi:NAD+ synthetase
MKVYNVDHNEDLKPGLKMALAEFRRIRGFDPATYADAKATLLNQYYKNTPLKTAIVLMSGGIDSSVVAALVAHAKKQPGSTIEKIIATTIPVYEESATGQHNAASRAHDVMHALGLPELTQEATSIHAAIVRVLEETRGVKLDPWARGQIVAHVRTALSAGNATVDAMLGKPGIVIGTTNRDEGAYLGYVGKWSDGMVDLQLISDLHKSEVYALARHLKLPQSTIDAIPKGDMYDNRADTEVFGASYDFVELYQNYLNLSQTEQDSLLASFNEDELAQFNGMAANLENLHRYNGHKYQGNQTGSPAFHLNILPSAVEGGWTSGKFGKEYPLPPNPERIFNGYFELSREFLQAAQGRNAQAGLEIEEHLITGPEDVHPKRARLLKPLIPAEEADALLAETADKKWKPAGLDGYKLKNPDDAIGSWRATAYSPEYAKILWSRIAGNIPMIRIIPEGTDVDAHNVNPEATVWRAVGINPAFRFISYDPAADNKLYPHYDAPPAGKNTPDTLDSLVIYLTDSKEGMGGETGFIVDPQAAIPTLERDVSEDWTRVAKPDEIIYKVNPQKGHALIFPHRALHSSISLDPESSKKVIIRSDIIWEPVVTP